MDNQEVSMDVETPIAKTNDDRSLPFSIFKKANNPVTLKVCLFIDKSCYHLDTYFIIIICIFLVMIHGEHTVVH